MPAVPVEDILNRRTQGENIVDWEFDFEVKQWRVTISSYAGKMTPPPLQTFGLLATAHIGAMTERDKQRADKASSLRMAAFVGMCMDELNNQVWKICSTLMQEGCEHYEDTLLRQPAADAFKRIALTAASESNDSEVASALTLWANGESADAWQEAVAVYKPMVRLAHTDVQVDPDRIPRYERDLHYNDLEGRIYELDTVLTLTILALTSPAGAKIWNKVIFYEQMQNTSKLFAELASNPSPFGWPSAGTEPLFIAKNHVLDAIKRLEYIELRASLNAEVQPNTPVIHMHGNHNSPSFCVGTASYSFVEALIVAAHFLHHAEKVTLDPGHVAKRPKNATGGQAVYAVNTSELSHHLEKKFGGWHHARCLEPRQTAQACLVNSNYDRVDKFFTTIGAQKRGNNPYQVYSMLISLDNPKIVTHPTVYVQGPGNGAVPTVCEAPEYLIPTEHFFSLEVELCRKVEGALEDLVANLPPTCLATKLRQRRQPAALLTFKLLTDTYNANARCLGSVIKELHVFDTIRSDAGKRYRYRLGVNASAIGVASALRNLLLAPANQEQNEDQV